MRHPSHHKSSFWALALSVAGFIYYPATASAQSIHVDQALSFGTFAVANSETVVEIIISENDHYTTVSKIYFLDDPQTGKYTLQNAPLSSPYTITVPTSVTLNGPGGNFILDEIKVSPETLLTDASGESEFTISGRLRSTASGVRYNDGRYSDSFTINLNF